jgi:hypothetical protein
MSDIISEDHLFPPLTSNRGSLYSLIGISGEIHSKSCLKNAAAAEGISREVIKDTDDILILLIHNPMKINEKKIKENGIYMIM